MHNQLALRLLLRVHQLLPGERVEGADVVARHVQHRELHVARRHQTLQDGEKTPLVETVVVHEEIAQMRNVGGAQVLVELGEDAAVQSHSLQVERLEPQRRRARQTLEELGQTAENVPIIANVQNTKVLGVGRGEKNSQRVHVGGVQAAVVQLERVQQGTHTLVELEQEGREEAVPAVGVVLQREELEVGEEELLRDGGEDVHRGARESVAGEVEREEVEEVACGGEVDEKSDAWVGEVGVGEREVGEAWDVVATLLVPERLEEELEAVARERDGGEIELGEVRAQREVRVLQQVLDAAGGLHDKPDAEEHVIERGVDHVREALDKKGGEIGLLNDEFELH